MDRLTFCDSFWPLHNNLLPVTFPTAEIHLVPDWQRNLTARSVEAATRFQSHTPFTRNVRAQRA